MKKSTEIVINKRALFLDRDGVICHMVKYPGGFDSAQRVEDVKLVHGIENVILTAKSKGWEVFEISNQPGVAKGKQTQELSDAIEAKVHSLLKEGAVEVDGVYICNHHPQAVVPQLAVGCDCRKPKPGLLLRAAEEYNIDLPSSVFYGDKASDVQASKAAGCKSMVLLHNEDTPDKVEEAQNASADFKVSSHAEASEILKTM